MNHRDRHHREKLWFYVSDDEVIKSVSTVVGVHEAQLLSYLKLGEYRVGLLINFNVKTLKDGIRRMRA